MVLVLSWASDSRIALVKWVPGWLAGWADSGRVMATMRTGIPLAVAGFLFSLAWRVSGWKHWIVGGIGLALGLVLAAEAGQWFLPARTAHWADVLWGAVGAVGGALVAGVAYRRAAKR